MITYKETQRFTQLYIWLPLIFSFIMVTTVTLVTLSKKENPQNMDYFSLGGPLIVLLTGYLLYLCKLEVEITPQFVRVKLFPFTKWKEYSWKSIQSAYVRTYKPLSEYGGWGIKGSRTNRAYNISGNKGLQLVFTDKKVLIGSNQTDKLNSYLLTLKEKYQIKSIVIEP